MTDIDLPSTEIDFMDTEEPLTDEELAEAIRDALGELNSLRADMAERGYHTTLVGEDGIEIFRDIREEL